MINTSIITGRLTKNIDIVKIQKGKSFARFSIAVDRRKKSYDGERVTDFINCVIWNKNAENLAQYTQKGSLIGVTGSLETNTYENEQGQRVYQTYIVVDKFDLLVSKPSHSESSVKKHIYPDDDYSEQTSFFRGQSTDFLE